MNIKDYIRTSIDSERLSEAVSHRAHGAGDPSNVMSYKEFTRLLIDSLSLGEKWEIDFPGDDENSMVTVRPDIFYRMLWSKIGDGDMFIRKKYQSTDIERFYYSVLMSNDRMTFWHLEFHGEELIRVEEYSYMRGGHTNLETQGAEAAEELKDYLKCESFEEKSLWKKRNL